MGRYVAVAVLVVATFVAGCADGGPSTLSITVPSPSPEPIGALPDDCEPGPRPEPVSDHVADAVGGEDVWAIGFGGPAATLSFSGDEPYRDHGWQRKVLWLLRRTATDPVTVTGVRLDDGSPLWLAYGDVHPPATDLRLDPAAPDGQDGDWFEYRGYFVVPSAGCYRLIATWPGGGWEIPFRAGLDETMSTTPR